MSGVRWKAVLWLTGVLLALEGAAPLWSGAQTSPGSATGQVNQVESVTLAHGVKSASVFGSGLLTPVDPATTFVNTDVPYAIVRIKALAPDTTVALRLADPSGSAYAVQAKIPAHRGNPKDFDFAAPLYILGTDLESHTGTWHVQILINNAPASDVTFQWQAATAAELAKLKDTVNQSPLTADLHWRYGAALGLLGHLSESITELQNAIRLDPNYALYYITLGRVYELQSRVADATQQFQKALSVHGSFYDSVFEGWARAGLVKLQAH
ncbi:MAG TPA: tetratricopeptide repeat protein [bacterium]|nr:tetratricopeptide repeat protein [bacterium]